MCSVCTTFFLKLGFRVYLNSYLHSFYIRLIYTPSNKVFYWYIRITLSVRLSVLIRLYLKRRQYLNNNRLNIKYTLLDSWYGCMFTQSKMKDVSIEHIAF